MSRHAELRQRRKDVVMLIEITCPACRSTDIAGEKAEVLS